MQSPPYRKCFSAGSLVRKDISIPMSDASLSLRERVPPIVRWAAGEGISHGQSGFPHPALRATFSLRAKDSLEMFSQYGPRGAIRRLSKIESHLSLELTMQRGFCIHPGDLAETEIVDVQRRVSRLRMVEHIAGVDPQFQSLRFADAELLRHIRIKSPSSRCFHHSLAESAAVSGKRVFEKSLIRVDVVHRVERTSRFEVFKTRQVGTLRILIGFESARRKIISAASAIGP